MHAVHAILLLFLLLLPLGVTFLAEWPWYLAGPLAIYAAVVAVVRPLRRTFGPVKLGRCDRQVALATAGIIGISSAALVAWYPALRPDLTAQAAKLSGWWVCHWFWAGALFASVNAVLEEIIFRGVLMESLTVELGAAHGNLAQAALFGLAHLHGVPDGILGVGMVMIYGAMLGWLRRLAGGLGAPVVAHVFADATILGLLIAHAGS